METAIVRNAEAADRLQALGLTDEVLRRAIEEGQRARADCTANDPHLFPGIVPWAVTTRLLREQLRLLGWTRREKSGQPLTVRPDGEVAIVAFGGDDATGDPDRIPRPRNPKGLMTLVAVKQNCEQLSLPFPDLPLPSAEESPILTWVLLYARIHGQVRFELSLPCAIGEDGAISGWSERIILSAIDLGDDAPIRGFETEPRVDFDVTRREG